MKYQEKKLIIFDLDGTLAASKSALDTGMADLIIRLLQFKKVAIISGGRYEQFETQFLSKLPSDATALSNLYLLPTSGTRLYAWESTWVEKYAENLSDEQRKLITEELNNALVATGFKPGQSYGDIIEDRGSQITFSALGQSAPLNLKMAWDPRQEKRKAIAKILIEKLPNFNVGIGGATSIDITMKGVSKEYGIHKLEQYLNIPINKMLFIGDALFPGGNDYPARSTGVDCIETSGPEETKNIIGEIIFN